MATVHYLTELPEAKHFLTLFPNHDNTGKTLLRDVIYLGETS